MIRSFVDLKVYQEAQSLYPKVVLFSRSFPYDARHLRDQLCRSANSIHANIAEGYGRSIPEFKLYLTRALGSCNETMSHIVDAINTGAGNQENAKGLLGSYDVVGKQLYRLRERWK